MVLWNSQCVALFIDPATRQWIVRDPEGDFWAVPPVDHGWKLRKPFAATDQGGLKPAPRYYLYMLDVPF